MMRSLMWRSRKSSILLLLLSVVGCKGSARQVADAAVRTPTRLPISAVRVLDRTPADRRTPGIDVKTLTSRVEARLRKATFIDRSVARGYRLRIEVGTAQRQTEAGKESFVAIVSARAEPPSIDKQALEASTVAPLDGKPAPERARQHVLRTLDHALGSVLFQAELTVAPPASLVAHLQEKDVDRLVSVIEVVAARKPPGAIERLITLLKHPQRRVSDRAIGALVTLGDRRAVRPLTRLVKFRDSARLATVIDGIGTLGGEEAKAFLEFVADGHAHAAVRNLAREALARLARSGR